jgi:hypothetical protein
VDELTKRVVDLERRAILDDELHKGLVATDGHTADAVRELTKAINDPRGGLIVELDNFRKEVAADRAVFRAQIRGATIVLSAVFGTVTILAPWFRAFVETALSVKVP